MTNIVSHDYNGFAISQKQNGYVSLTDMATASGKKVNDYLRLDSTVEYLEALSTDTGFPVSSLVKVSKGGNVEQGTWAHPEIAIDFATWCNVYFRIWANRTLQQGMKAFANDVNGALREIKRQSNVVKLEIEQIKLCLIKSKLDRFKSKIAPIVFNESIVAWVDRYLAYCEGSILYIGIAGKKANTLSTSYAAFCIRNDFAILGQQRFSSELMKYLSHGKQWQINKQPRDSTGTCILNIAFA